MRRSPTSRRWTLTVPLAAALCLVLTGSAFAAPPKAGKLYTGHTTASYNYFTAPVSFTVSRNGKQLLRFKWTGGGCIGLGGPGNAWTNPELSYKLGTINLSRSGSFSVKNVKVTFTGKQGGTSFTKVTISTVKGRFKTATTATGTIYFTQKLTGAGKCSGHIPFTAALGPAPDSLHKTGPTNGATVKSTAPTLTWTASRNATKYSYCLDSSNGTCSGSWVSTGKTTHTTLKNLKTGATYYWQVLASSVHGTVAADSGSWHAFTVAGGGITPQTGTWRSTSVSPNGSIVQVTSVGFGVTNMSVSGFGFGYSYANGTCPHGSGSSYPQSRPASPIINGRFKWPGGGGGWTGIGSGDFQGTFDSPTTAHGTASFSWNLTDPGIGCLRNGTNDFTWTAHRQP